MLVVLELRCCSFGVVGDRSKILIIVKKTKTFIGYDSDWTYLAGLANPSWFSAGYDWVIK